MIKKSLVKKMLEKQKKKIGKKALKKLDFLADNYIKSLIAKASRKADIFGRIVLREEDFD